MRYYSFFIVSYHTLPEVELFVKNCSKYAYIYHDKDNTDSHFHIACTFKGNRSFNSVKGLFPDTANCFVQPMYSKHGSFAYLTHSDDPDKFQYSSDSIVTNDRSYFEGSLVENSIDSLIDDLSPFSRLTFRELAIKYGRDFIKNYNVYKSYSSMCLTQERDIDLGFNSNLSLLSYNDFLFDYYNALCSDFIDINYCFRGRRKKNKKK